MLNNNLDSKNLYIFAVLLCCFLVLWQHPFLTTEEVENLQSSQQEQQCNITSQIICGIGQHQTCGQQTHHSGVMVNASPEDCVLTHSFWWANREWTENKRWSRRWWDGAAAAAEQMTAGNQLSVILSLADRDKARFILKGYHTRRPPYKTQTMNTNTKKTQNTCNYCRVINQQLC